MPQLNLTDEELDKINRLINSLSEDEDLQQKMKEYPQEVLKEFELDRLTESALDIVGMFVPNEIYFTAMAMASGSGGSKHADSVLHWDHTNHTNHTDNMGPIWVPS